ncbi:uncharacterized protein PgNI_12122 [Pyricularia grisea]|uniref:Cytochrome b561 domain-containing protein n=1 Tax=Pyricularia grisea TaxID=148305 RepID=A0A6P8AQR1_PYRGI|nr:uncharacterized protein PgNI_12122 [Pyricularia grisea]TLD04397.1 hypothetical protein PgNI_12122 [Pyricularia grisea]
MAIKNSRILIQQAALCVCFATLALASPQFQFPGSNNGNNGGNNNGGTGSGSGSGTGGTGAGSGNGNGNGSGNGNGNGNGFGGNGQGFGNNGQNGFNNFLGFDVNRAMYLRMVHGWVASVAFVILFPLGSIFIRVIPGRFSFLAHVATQIIASILYIVGAGIGFWMLANIRFPFNGGSLLTDPNINYHPIIGIVVFVGVLAQPGLGFMHHAQYKKLGRRQIWSHLHLWNGRLMIALGIVNGGLGLLVARASDQARTAYAAVAGVMSVLWILASIFGECKKAIEVRRQSRAARKEAKRNERLAAKNLSRPSSQGGATV